VTPTKAQSMDPVEVKRVCHDYTMAGLSAMYEAGPAKPFRFLYMSGNNAVRDPAKKPRILGDYCVMRVSSSHWTFVEGGWVLMQVTWLVGCGGE
jgi:hypothetical protein